MSSLKELIDTLVQDAPANDPNGSIGFGFTNLQMFLPGFEAGKGALGVAEVVGIPVKEKCIVEGEIQVTSFCCLGRLGLTEGAVRSKSRRRALVGTCGCPGK
jgi:hypothetical protein